MYDIINGSSAEVLKTFPDNHFDSVVCDPPYLIGFLGKEWDHKDAPLLAVFQECLRVLKPGGHLLAFSAARTYHKLATSVEEAGFEIRDQIMWIFSSGFPKSQDVGKSIDRAAGKLVLEGTGKTRVSDGARDDLTGVFPRSEETIHHPQTEAAKEWSGWGTSLKPAHEPIVMARKPLKQSIAKNCQEYGTAALNIDACRIAVDSDELESFQKNWKGKETVGMGEYQKLDGTVAAGAHQFDATKKNIEHYTPQGRFPSNVLGEIEGYQKFFYCPKVSRKERHCGFDTTQYRLKDDVPLEVVEQIKKFLNV